jgi:ABC-type Zn uptake system ZnuABC Zn-binding protein ZnuA
MVSKIIKYLLVKLNKEGKMQYIENYKKFLREIKEATNELKDIPCS